MKAKAIDASHLEGGGQVVRIAVTLSALTSKPIALRNIRGNRSGGGGLKGQHLTAIQWLAKACNAKVEGLELKNQTLVFQPCMNSLPRKVMDDLVKPIVLDNGDQALETTVDLETNGAATLVLQTMLPYLIFCPPTRPGYDRSTTPIVLTVRGGTNVPLSPSIDYLLNVFSPNLARMGIKPLELHSLKRGYTTGARSALGSVSLLIHPLAPGSQLPHLILPPPTPRCSPSTGALPATDSTAQAPTTLKSISIHILAPSSTAIAALRSAALALVRSTFFPDLALPSSANTTQPQPPPDKTPRIQIHASSSSDTANKRFYLLLAATHVSGWILGADWLYDGRGLRTDAQRRGGVETVLPAHVLERVAKKMAEKVVGELKAVVDEGAGIDRWMEDQVVVFAALAGRSEGASAKGSSVDETEVLESLSHDDKGEDGENGEGMGGAGSASENVAGGPTLHTITARWIASELLGVEFEDTGHCDGIGLEAV